MPTIRIPTPLRPYTHGQAEVPVAGNTVSAALGDLTRQHPNLRQHLYTDDGELRAFVNVFLNNEDIRHLHGSDTHLAENDRLMIVPSIAGGQHVRVDHSALRTNQAFIIGLNIAAFVANAPWLAALVALAMAAGAALGVPGFVFFYKRILRPLGWVKPDVIEDNPEPHRFAQGFGAVVLAAGVAALWTGAGALGWGLVWLVVALAALNLFAGFCAGCAVYYWLNRLHVPGFVKSAPQGTFPGMRPGAGV